MSDYKIISIPSIGTVKVPAEAFQSHTEIAKFASAIRKHPEYRPESDRVYFMDSRGATHSIPNQPETLAAAREIDPQLQILAAPKVGD